MELARDIYRAFEDIVGQENISEDMAVIDGYAFTGQHTAAVKRVDAAYRFHVRPAAIIMPGTTHEIQSIVKLCNRLNIKTTALSTGYGSNNQLESEGEVVMDLRRMNRILELDEKNMFIVVEPYVSFAQVQAEIMRRGLMCNIVGAGCNASYLASHTSVGGNNTQALSQGYSGRNLLGMEWVLPTGEIVRVGSLGSGSGWFSGDGPGPSLRGIIRGSSGHAGSIGVFTKCAGHLHPWYGPPVMEIKGNSPYYEAEIPPTHEYHVLEWPSWEKCGDALSKIGEAQIGFSMHKTGGPGTHGSVVTGNNNEYYEKRQAGELGLPRISYSLVMTGLSNDEHAYQVKTLNKILEQTGGKIAAVGEDQVWKKRDYINMIGATFIPRLAFRCTGTFAVDGLVGVDTVAHSTWALELDEPHRDRYAAMGVILDDGSTNSWGAPYEGSHLALYEAGHPYNPMDEKSAKGMQQMEKDGQELALKNNLAGAGMAVPAVVNSIGPRFPEWQAKIKKLFDPKTLFDAKQAGFK